MAQHQTKPVLDKVDPVWARIRREAEDAAPDHDVHDVHTPGCRRSLSGPESVSRTNSPRSLLLSLPFIAAPT
jgi:hypothetical protein